MVNMLADAGFGDVWSRSRKDSKVSGDRCRVRRASGCVKQIERSRFGGSSKDRRGRVEGVQEGCEGDWSIYVQDVRNGTVVHLSLTGLFDPPLGS